MHRIYQRLFKEGNVDRKYLRCSDLQDNNFEVMHTAIVLNKIDIACVDREL